MVEIKKRRIFHSRREAMNKKYKLLKEDTISVEGNTLYRIQALRSFGNVEEGDLGGYVAIEANLSHCNDAWVFEDAMVYGYARVYDNALVYGKAVVHGEAEVYDEARVFENAEVFCHAQVYGHAEAYDNVQVYGETWISAMNKVNGDMKIENNTVCFNMLFGGLND